MSEHKSIFATCFNQEGWEASEPYMFDPRFPPSWVNPDSADGTYGPERFHCADLNVGVPCFHVPPGRYADGGYPIVYYQMSERGGCDATLCAICAGKARDERAWEIATYDGSENYRPKPLPIEFWHGHRGKYTQPAIIGDIHHEGSSDFCDDCDVEIPSAYSDPDARSPKAR